MAFKKNSLGKGLDAIFIDNETEQLTDNTTDSQNDNNTTTDKNVSKGVSMINVSLIEPNHNQPRKIIDDEALSELSDSILRHGIIQPILVRPIGDNSYQIVAGERRFRAARMAGLMEIPVNIKEMSEQEVAEIALIENLQRENLTPMEEANGYKTLMDEYSLTQEDVAKAVGKSRPAITNVLRLLNLPLDVQKMLDKRELTFGHARTLLGLDNEKDMLSLAKLVIQKEISVRELEKLVKDMNSNSKDTPKTKKAKRDSYYDEVELSLKEVLGRKVKINNKTKDSGKLEIEFYSKDDLKDIANKLS